MGWFLQQLAKYTLVKGSYACGSDWRLTHAQLGQYKMHC